MFEGLGARRRTPLWVLFAAAVGIGCLAPVGVRAAGADDATVEVQSLETATQKNPKDPVAQTKLATAYLARAQRRGDFRDIERAATAAADAVKLQPKHVPAIVLLGSCRLAQFRFDDAIQQADQALAIQADSREALGLRADARRQSGDLVGAREDLQKLLDAKADVSTQLLMTDLLIDEGDAAAAVASVEAALAEAEKTKAPVAATASCFVKLGALRFHAGEWDEAEKYYRRAIDLAPEDPDAIDHLAEVLAARGQFDEAVKLMDQLKPVREQCPTYLRARGDLALAMGRHDDAFAWHEKALAGFLEAAGAGYLPACRQLAALYCDVDAFRNPADAVRWARRDAQTRRTVDSIGLLAWALYQDGRIAEATANMDKAHRDKTINAMLLYRAGLVYSEDRDKTRSRTFFRRAATVNPKFQEFHFFR